MSLSKVKVSCDSYDGEERRQTKDRKIATCTPEKSFSMLLHVHVTSQQAVLGHYRPTSETPFE